MKRISIALVLLLVVSVTSAQSFKELADTQFTNTKHYQNSEQNIIHSVNYLFSTPYNTADQNRILALQFITKWMQGTPDYTFSIDQKVTQLTEGHEGLLELYKAAMVKTTIENKHKDISIEALHLKTEALLAAYCANRQNKLKPSMALKKRIKNRKG